MGLWCGQLGVGGWLALTVGWAAIVGLAVWAVCRLFPAQRRPEQPDEHPSATTRGSR